MVYVLWVSLLLDFSIHGFFVKILKICRWHSSDVCSLMKRQRQTFRDIRQSIINTLNIINWYCKQHFFIFLGCFCFLILVNITYNCNSDIVHLRFSRKLISQKCETYVYSEVMTTSKKFFHQQIYLLYKIQEVDGKYILTRSFM